MLRIRVDWTIASELAWNGMDRTYALLGRPALHDPDRFFLAVDHTVDPVTLANDARARRSSPQLSRDFAKESGITPLLRRQRDHPAHQVLPGPGAARRGRARRRLAHLARTAAWARSRSASAAPTSPPRWCSARSWIEVPEAIAVEYAGDAAPSASAARTSSCGRSARSGATPSPWSAPSSTAARRCSRFSTDVRFTIANMTAEFGGLNGIFEADEVVADWLARRRDGYNDGAALLPRRRRRALRRALPHRPRPARRRRWRSPSRPTTSSTSRSWRASRSTAASSAPAPRPRRSWCSARWCSRRR